MAAESPPRASVRLPPPEPMGFLGLAVASAISAGLQLGWIPRVEAHEAGLAILVFSPPLQFVASVFSFLRGEATTATGMGVLSASWLATGVLLFSLPPAGTSLALGVLMAAAGTALLVPGGFALLRETLSGAVVITAAAHFLLYAGSQFAHGGSVMRASGALGIFLAVLALACALVVMTRATGG